MKTRTLVVFGTLAVSVSAACKDTTEPVEPAGLDLVDGSSGVGRDADVGPVDAGPPDARPPGCPVGLPGPAMVAISAPDTSIYCMDRTEVTQAQYGDFLLAKGAEPLSVLPTGDVSGQIPACDWNERFVPDPFEPSCEVVVYIASQSSPDAAVSCVDWCDALAYCTWAEKRLCGKIGGGTLPAVSIADTNVSEWHNACTAKGTTVYTYGNTYKADSCLARNDGATSLFETPDCHGSEAPFDQLLNLSGNVAEWEDACDGEAESATCLVRSANLMQNGEPSEATRCDYALPLHPGAIRPSLGFRCCSDAK